MWQGQTIGTFDFTCRRVTLNPCISATNQHFEKQKKVFLVWGLRNVSQKFKTSESQTSLIAAIVFKDVI